MMQRTQEGLLPPPTLQRSNLCPGIPLRVHFLGAGGAGVSGAARVLHDHGHVLSGHDRAESRHVELLREMDVNVEVCPQAAAQLPEGVQLVVRSAAISSDDPQLRDASERGIPVLKYSELLGRITPPGRTLAVAGTHGKTTSSWLTFHALRGVAEAMDQPRPGAIIGGICGKLGKNAVTAEPSGLFVVEACEYDRSFLKINPQCAIITNVEDDHLDYFGTSDEIHKAFSQFAHRVHPEGLLVLGKDVPRTIENSARCKVWRLGHELHAELVSERLGRFTMRLRGPGFEISEIALGVPGQFNVDNAALALGLAIGSSMRAWPADLARTVHAAARGVERFGGAKRRFESWGSSGGVELVHDYAHHPTEVRVTIEAAQRVFAGRPLHVLFQPHQHSRTSRFLAEFVESLRSAHRVVIADVYGARNHIDGANSATATDIANGLASCKVSAFAPGDKANSARVFAAGLPDNGVGLVLGAGDIEDVQDELLAHLALRRTVASTAR
ncbi:MAG TPA: Mur ligase family protein [Planctomycetota bacterium]|nr:Mur ligase family protein [Planctomycetota bacterium]